MLFSKREGKSFIYKLNRDGLRLQPCLVPIAILNRYPRLPLQFYMGIKLTVHTIQNPGKFRTY